VATIVSASQGHHQVVIKKALKVKKVIGNIIRAYIMGSHKVCPNDIAYHILYLQYFFNYALMMAR
jgi:hypothetical protein